MPAIFPPPSAVQGRMCEPAGPSLRAALGPLGAPSDAQDGGAQPVTAGDAAAGAARRLCARRGKPPQARRGAGGRGASGTG